MTKKPQEKNEEKQTRVEEPTEEIDKSHYMLFTHID